VCAGQTDQPIAALAPVLARRGCWGPSCAPGPSHLRVLRPDDGRQLLHHLRRAVLRQHVGLAQQVGAHDDWHIRSQPPQEGHHVEAGVPDLRRVQHASVWLRKPRATDTKRVPGTASLRLLLGGKHVPTEKATALSTGEACSWCKATAWITTYCTQ